MRIKSYFAHSVQSAIGLARKEFGDDVTLVTSHAASLESRHLGEYEVVFAVDEVSDQAESAVTSTPTPEPPKVFQDLLQEAIIAKPSTHEGLPGKLEHLRSCFIEIGIEPPMVRALMTMVEHCAPLSAQQETSATETDIEAEPEAVAMPAPESVAPVKPRFTPAEMAFVISVSVVDS